jgi:hypothetical protein
MGGNVPLGVHRLAIAAAIAGGLVGLFLLIEDAPYNPEPLETLIAGLVYIGASAALGFALVWLVNWVYQGFKQQ